MKSVIEDNDAHSEMAHRFTNILVNIIYADLDSLHIIFLGLSFDYHPPSLPAIPCPTQRNAQMINIDINYRPARMLMTDARSTVSQKKRQRRKGTPRVQSGSEELGTPYTPLGA